MLMASLIRYLMTTNPPSAFDCMLMASLIRYLMRTNPPSDGLCLPADGLPHQVLDEDEAATIRTIDEMTQEAHVAVTALSAAELLGAVLGADASAAAAEGSASLRGRFVHLLRL
jgi:hypothetical protein